MMPPEVDVARRILALGAWLAIASACDELPIPSTTGHEDATPVLKTTRSTVRSNESGLVAIPVDIDDEDALLVTARADTLLALEAVYDPDGERVLYWLDWEEQPRTLTWALTAHGRDMTLNWPVRAEDGPLTPGTWTVVIATLDDAYAYRGGQELDVAVQVRTDGDLSQGTVSVRVLTADGVGDQPDVVAAIDAAIPVWEAIWAEAGLALDVTRGEAPQVPAEVPYPYEGDPTLEAAAEAGTDTDLVMIIGEAVGSTGLLGHAGSVPNALVATPRAAVALSWLGHAGPDGVFSEAEVQGFGETMAHEAGHYLGLAHPVEVEWDRWDALDDTPECGGVNACETTFATHLMFPYPVCPGLGACNPMQDITDDQRAVLQRYAGSL